MNVTTVALVTAVDIDSVLPLTGVHLGPYLIFCGVKGGGTPPPPAGIAAQVASQQPGTLSGVVSVVVGLVAVLHPVVGGGRLLTLAVCDHRWRCCLFGRPMSGN